MNAVCLPEKVRKIVADAADGGQPVCAVRASGSLDGSSGEGYAIALTDRLLLFSRGIGDLDYTEVCLGYGDITEMAIKAERYGSFLEILGPERRYSVKFASYERRDVLPLLEQWREALEPDGSSEDPTVGVRVADGAMGSVPLSPSGALGASLMFMATVDQDIDAAEDAYIKDLCSAIEGTHEEALSYYNDHDQEELLAAMSGLDRQQRLCILANMIELAMSDGVLHTSEQRLSSRFAQAFGVTDRELRTIMDVLLIKNQTSVLRG